MTLLGNFGIVYQNHKRAADGYASQFAQGAGEFQPRNTGDVVKRSRVQSDSIFTLLFPRRSRRTEEIRCAGVEQDISV